MCCSRSGFPFLFNMHVKSTYRGGFHESQSERFRLSSPVAVAARKRAGLPPLVAHQRAVLARAGNAPTVKALEAPDSIPPLPEDTWTEEVNLSTISTLKQRFQMPAHQPQSLKELSPRKQVLRIRRSMRCRHCEHNLCKLEYYPTSCKFKIQLNAFYHIPEIRMSALPSVLRPGGDISFILTVRNPTQYDTTIKILPFDTEPPETEVGQLPSPLPSSLGSPPVPPALTPCPPQQVPNCFLVFPLGQDKVEVLVPARNEVADFDPTTPKIPQEDESSLIVWKDTNKVALKLRTKLATEPGTVARLGLVLAFDYISAMVAPGCQQVQCPVYIKTQLNLGNIAMASS
ncbi:unnamed protein product [Cyprideis torosa]|uniref:Dynactin subunit 4 n=1 Tax=Cyprideis torosa TaxID=163714 RepID=A0A7R8ZQ13_9CRUS|nr:unnamed protein product [Cyprideis torosa]CAG0900254.1 unnamed protein product [Cyprideis torosa]